MNNNFPGDNKNSLKSVPSSNTFIEAQKKEDYNNMKLITNAENKMPVEGLTSAQKENNLKKIMFEKELAKILTDNNIKVQKGEYLKIDISIDNNVVVSGLFDHKKEELLAKIIASGDMALKLQFLTRQTSPKYINLSTDERNLIYRKYLAVNWVDEYSNGKKSLDEIELIEGKLVGFSENTTKKLYGSLDNLPPSEKIDVQNAVNTITKIKNFGEINISDLVSSYIFKDGKLDFFWNEEKAA